MCFFRHKFTISPFNAITLIVILLYSSCLIKQRYSYHPYPTEHTAALRDTDTRTTGRLIPSRSPSPSRLHFVFPGVVQKLTTPKTSLIVLTREFSRGHYDLSTVAGSPIK